MHRACTYIDGTLPSPDPTTDTKEAATWSANNLAVIAAIRDCYSSEEQVFLRGERNAHLVWTNLRRRHEHVSPAVQAQLIQKLLGARYRRSERFATTIMAIVDDVRRIFSMGIPTKDTFTLVIMMVALSEEFSSVRDHIANCISQSTTAPCAPGHTTTTNKRSDTIRYYYDTRGRAFFSDPATNEAFFL